MKEILISSYIDDELDLDEKIEFVEAVHAEATFTHEVLDLLRQEQLLSGPLVDRQPQVHQQAIRAGVRQSQWSWRNFLRLPVMSGTLGAVAVLVLMLVLPNQEMDISAPSVLPQLGAAPHRFVVYEPDSSSLELVGSFTRWQPVPMQRVGSSGYWALTMQLPEGEYRYGYRVGGTQQIADPTVAERELDDFGGVNSVLTVSLSI